MTSHRELPGSAAVTVSLTGIFVLLTMYTLYFARPFLLPIVVATVLNFLLSPVVRGLSRAHVPRAIGAGLVILALLGIVIGVGVFVLCAIIGLLALLL